MDPANLFEPGEPMPEEVTTVLYESATTRVEQIISWGQATAESFWYDQAEGEWLILLKGRAVLRYDDGSLIALRKGKPHLIPAHARHQVAATTAPTIWLCVFSKISEE